jgi:hypothetical protein
MLDAQRKNDVRLLPFIPSLPHSLTLVLTHIHISIQTTCDRRPLCLPEEQARGDSVFPFWGLCIACLCVVVLRGHGGICVCVCVCVYF